MSPCKQHFGPERHQRKVACVEQSAVELALEFPDKWERQSSSYSDLGSKKEFLLFFRAADEYF